MPQIERVDFPSKRIFLHLDTVGNGFDAIAGHFEIKRIIADNIGNGQNFGQVSDALGNEPKGGGKFTARSLQLFPGWRFVPHPSSHNLRLLVEIINPNEELSNRDLFDRDDSTLDGFEVDIDNAFTEVEIREVVIGEAAAGGFAASDRAMLKEIRANTHSINSNNP